MEEVQSRRSNNSSWIEECDDVSNGQDAKSSRTNAEIGLSKESSLCMIRTIHRSRRGDAFVLASYVLIVLVSDREC